MDIPLLLRRSKEAWFVSFLSEWLSFSDLVSLDNAITLHEDRKYFHSCLEKLNQEIRWDTSNMSLQWLSLRKIPACTVVLQCDVTKVDQLINLSLPSLEKLVVLFQEDSKVRNEDQCILNLIRNSPNLQSIHLHDQSNGITHVGIRQIAQSCQNTLTNFHLCCNKYPVTTISVDQLVEFFTQCTKLETVGLVHGALENYSGDDLRQLQRFGHLFVCLGLINDPFSHNTSSNDIVELLKVCGNLKEFDYTSVGSDNHVVLDSIGGDACPLLERFQQNMSRRSRRRWNFYRHLCECLSSL